MEISQKINNRVGTIIRDPRVIGETNLHSLKFTHGFITQKLSIEFLHIPIIKKIDGVQLGKGMLHHSRFTSWVLENERNWIVDNWIYLDREVNLFNNVTWKFEFWNLKNMYHKWTFFNSSYIDVRQSRWSSWVSYQNALLRIRAHSSIFASLQTGECTAIHEWHFISI